MQFPILPILVGLLVVAVVILGLLLVAVMRQVGAILLQISPARPGDIEGGPELGTNVEVPGLEKNKPAIVVFVAPGCNVCEPLLPVIPIVERNYPELQVCVAIGGEDEHEREAYAQQLKNLARPDLHRLHRNWEVPGTPYAVGLDLTHRVVRTGVVNNLDHLEALAEFVVHANEIEGSTDTDGPRDVIHELAVVSAGQGGGERNGVNSS